MNDNTRYEERFIAQAASVDVIGHSPGEILDRLRAWEKGVGRLLSSARIRFPGIANRSALAQQVEALNSMVIACLENWPRQWAELEPAQQLAEVFDDKVLLLVFGKFNAGKSSLCNFLAERFVARGKAVHHFYVQDATIKDAAGPFQEGSTETTTRLQGVCLGERLVLLDTPGLHSMTPENAALTGRFTDSADGVLWLTSSASPGQVQELDELARELRRDKPLLPVLTRSDVYEEDEVDNQIVRLLCNKAGHNRTLQEADVAERARAKLAQLGVNIELLENPVSISAYVARQQGQTAEAMQAAGFERLYAALMAITEPALTYKRFKPAAVLLHHLDEHIAGDFRSSLLPCLAKLQQQLLQWDATLERQRDQFLSVAWRSIVAQLPRLLEDHAGTGDAAAARTQAAQWLGKTAAKAIDEVFADFDIGLDPALIPPKLDGVAVYGIQAGTPDYADLHTDLKESIHSNLLKIVGTVISHCHRSIDQLRADLAQLQTTLSAQDRELLELKSLLMLRRG